MASGGIGSDGPTEAMVHGMLERMGEAGIERLQESDVALHRGRRMPRPEDFAPPPAPAGPARRLRTSKEGTGFFTYQAEDSVEVIVHTTVQSHVRLRAGELLFHVGWPGVPAGWHHAVQLMQFGEVSTFALGAEDVWGLEGGDFEALLEGPRPAPGSEVELELELRSRAEGFFPGSVLAGQSMPARFWIRRGQGSARPARLDPVEVRFAAWAAPAGALAADAPNVARGAPLFDARAPAAPLSFAVGEGAVFDILERVLLDMRPGDTARLLLEAGVPSAPEVFGELAPSSLAALALEPGPLEFEITDLTFEPAVDPRTAAPAALQARVLALREEGNARVKLGRFQRAVCWYEKGLEVLGASQWREKVVAGSELETVFRGATVAMLNNLAHCHLQSKPSAPRKAVEACSKALEAEPGNVKAMFRKGKALVELGEHAEAEEVLSQAAKLEPKDTAIRKELETAKRALAKAKKAQKSTFGGMFSRLQGFAADDRPEAPAEETGEERLYCLRKKPEENPFTGSHTARDDAQRLEEEGCFEQALWAWEAAVQERQESLDFPTCWLCWFNLARLYVDLMADATALLCLERFVKTGDLPAPPASLLRHVHLLRGFCVLSVPGTAQSDRVPAVVSCVERWVKAGNSTARDSSDSMLAQLESMAASEDSALATDASMALALLGLLREGGPNTSTIEAIAYAVALPEAEGSLFGGSSGRRAAKWNALGSALAHEQPEQALLAYAAALEARPCAPRALANAGRVLQRLERWEEAMAMYARAVALVPAFLAEPLWQAIGGLAQHPDLTGAKMLEAVEHKDAALLGRCCSRGAKLPPVPDNVAETLKQMGLTGAKPTASVLS